MFTIFCRPIEDFGSLTPDIDRYIKKHKLNLQEIKNMVLFRWHCTLTPKISQNIMNREHGFYSLIKTSSNILGNMNVNCEISYVCCYCLKI